MTQANKPSLTTKRKKGRLKEYRWPITGMFFSKLLLAAFVIRLHRLKCQERRRHSIRYDSGWKMIPSQDFDFVTVAVKEATRADLIYAWATPLQISTLPRI